MQYNKAFVDLHLALISASAPFSKTFKSYYFNIIKLVLAYFPFEEPIRAVMPTQSLISLALYELLSAERTFMFPYPS